MDKTCLFNGDCLSFVLFLFRKIFLDIKLYLKVKS